MWITMCDLIAWRYSEFESMNIQLHVCYLYRTVGFICLGFNTDILNIIENIRISKMWFRKPN